MQYKKNTPTASSFPGIKLAASDDGVERGELPDTKLQFLTKVSIHLEIS